MLPNTAPVLIARAAIIAADAIIVEASLSFIGLGVQPPSASWGTLMQQGYQQIFLRALVHRVPGRGHLRGDLVAEHRRGQPARVSRSEGSR